MKHMKLEITPIGFIRTPLKSSADCSIQSIWSNVNGEAEISMEFIEGLASLDGFSHIILFYWFHKAKHAEMRVRPYLDKKERGLFSTRAPSRPNPIGLSIVRLLKIDGTRLFFEGADMLDESRLIDIKPYVPAFDNRLDATSGWISASLEDTSYGRDADNRFQK
ncbi:MAG: tRNA (N6-threonylcarbamoyladenosine(37)-N6)-methyltransferase TrmO [Candidatus Thorarchaeota archaeon]|nr:MAG: tRNA (N6-threonylcarbamoyladenosine(37)-N6)-methyltransferase TrmO [Candidatus Thorarchaeota archaeon]